MNELIRTLLFRIRTLNIFRRRFFIYRNTTKSGHYYVKTRKLFFIPKFIHFNKYGDLTSEWFKFNVCRHNNIEECTNTIIKYKRNHMSVPKLKYERIW